MKKQPFLTGFPRTVFATAIRRQQARTTTNPAGEVTTTTLDRHGRPTAVQLPDNSFTYTSYHPNGQVAAKWGRLTNPTFTLYDDQGRVQELRTFATLSAEPTATTSGFAQTTWQYSPTTGLLLSKKDHLLQGASYTYTAAGRLASRTWARSTTAAPQTTQYQYSQGMLTRTDYSDTTPDVTITYDLLGRQDSLQSTVSRTDFVYHSNTLDLDKEIITHTLPGQASFTRTIDRSKDALHRATGYQVLNTNTFELGARYDYSATFGRLAKVSRLSSATTTAEEFGYGYTAQSNLIASVAGPAHTVSNTYEAQRDVLLTKANQRATDNSVISSIGYTVNNIGQRTNATRSGSATNTTAWGYDALGQVTSADDSNNNADRAYLYDTIGNRKKSADSLTLPASENYSVNDLNQYTNIGGFLPTYDKDGNQLNAQIQPQASATLINAVYEWDGENRLRRVKNSAGAILVEYHYDAQSRRIATSASGTTTLFLYDGWNVIAEYQLQPSSFNLHTSYLWGLDLSGSMQGAGGVGGLLAVTEIPATSAPATYYPLFDGNGNITEYIDGAGSVVAQYQYDPFGNTTLTSGTKANDFAYRFSTKPLDSATGLYYYGYRYYTPQTGRWINRDPIEENGGLNLYGFVGNSPFIWVDYLGLKKENCRTTSIPLSLDFDLKPVPIGPFAVAGGIAMIGSVSIETCDYCCDNKIVKGGFEEGKASLGVKLHARATWGMDREVNVNGLKGALWAGLQFFGEGTAKGNGFYTATCGGSKDYDVIFTLDIAGGVRGGANLAILHKNLTWQQFGGYIEGTIGSTCSFKINCNGGSCKNGFQWLGCVDNYGKIEAIINIGSFTYNHTLYQR